ncbi:Protein of unknown function [Pyronema omphalodes CBS 100304]|uniref:Uncharacterized protein n=1 Tax=Pyronema omphalodes (strain CBS 100304) TaxID=1076935 RepID=U4KW96_PYROM|nr:Protein of unknown function [Pyronema omphalodes CBS 100304]
MACRELFENSKAIGVRVLCDLYRRIFSRDKGLKFCQNILSNTGVKFSSLLPALNGYCSTKQTNNFAAPEV